ncbi:MAG: hypothetical protein R2991_10810 [Thermoanaerobaculia bacterium]
MRTSCRTRTAPRAAGRTRLAQRLPGDRVCIARDARRQVRENGEAPGRTGVLRSGPNGPRQCLPGFVWREAGPNDFACVPPDSRTLARRQNAGAPDRTGSDVCKPGPVWREAVLEDHVCVSIHASEPALTTVSTDPPPRLPVRTPTPASP